MLFNILFEATFVSPEVNCAGGSTFQNVTAANEILCLLFLLSQATTIIPVLFVNVFKFYDHKIGLTRKYISLDMNGGIKSLSSKFCEMQSLYYSFLKEMFHNPKDYKFGVFS